jgi:hypothetical protein
MPEQTRRHARGGPDWRPGPAAGSGCDTVTPRSSDIRWPADLRPDGAPVFAHNELVMDAAPEHVWAWLVRAALWPDWYRHCRRVRFENAPGPDLALGTRFTWSTLGVRVDTTVDDWEPPRRLGWRGGALGAAGYHGWTIEPAGPGVRVVTEEVQRGLLPSVARVVLRASLRRVHQEWLRALARAASGGLPPGAS